MFQARDAHTNKIVDITVCQTKNAANVPTRFLCPGSSPDGQACQAEAFPCALDSAKISAYFRVGSLENHIEQCSALLGLLPRVGSNPFLVDTRGVQGARGPQRIVKLSYLSQSQESQTVCVDDTGSSNNVGSHRFPAPQGRSNKPLVQSFGLRAFAFHHAEGRIGDDMYVEISPTAKGKAKDVVFPAHRLISAPYKGGVVVTYGRIASISTGRKPGTYFIRMALPHGGQTKVSLMLTSEQSSVIDKRFRDVLAHPTQWGVIAVGRVEGKTFEYRHFDPLDEFCVEFDKAFMRS